MGLISQSGILFTIIAIILYIGINKPENFKIYFGFVLELLSWPFSIFRKRAVRFQIEGPTTRALKKLSKEVPDLEVPDLNIQWVTQDNLETKLKEGKAIIKL